MELLTLVSKEPSIAKWQSACQKRGRQLITGLSGSAKNLVMATALDGIQKKILVITPTLYHATQVAEDLASIHGEEKVFAFSVNEVLAAEMAISSPEAISERIAALDFLTSEEEGFLVVPIAAMRKYLPKQEDWRENHLELKIDDEVEFEDLPELLVRMGYRREMKVETVGEFSIRGSILDIYPLTFEHPIRVEFFDVEVDSLRLFDVETQRSLEPIEEVIIPPASECIFTKENFKRGAKLLEDALSKKVNASKQEGFENYFEHILTCWRGGLPSDDDNKFLDFLYQEKHTLFHYLGKDSLVFVDDYARILEVNRQILMEESTWHTMKLEEGKAFSNQQFGVDVVTTLKNLNQSTTYFSLFHKGMGNLQFEGLYNFTQHNMQQFFGQMPLLKAEIGRYQSQHNTILILVENEERLKKTENLFHEWDIPVVATTPQNILEGETQILQAELLQGFDFPSAELVVLTEKEIFNASKKRRARRNVLSNAERLKSYNELKVGDYVVHANHGIGQYVGMETIEVRGVHQDYLSILYQNDDKLFIPVTQLNLISKYTSSEGKQPKLNKMNDSKWAKTKSKVSKQVEDIADDLIALYAERDSRVGFAFSPDTEYQKEFEDAFPYAETEDQLRSAEEIKKDMERARPMDRLLVGDVGFGKTEVALRAAFKAVADHKQVVILAPTTILAQQHFETMQERFRGFPVEIGLLSRFRTKKEQNQTLEDLKKNRVDIVIGTHRLLSKDVEFFDLGLLIIDEEQRFGVKHKERLKQLKTQVDVLTLTATPIPRTLHMSMMGVRDLSVIETPPANRFPVQTYVMEQNMGAVRDAVLREIGRGGQVFYLYNRVDSIERKVSELQALIPEASIGFAHGQMSEIQLENVLYDFIDRQYDILVTTTIIETGVDIPNANTMFIENSDYMGLSTLYQLRGRVGRSNRVAYTYFMYRPDKVLSEVSEKRLQAMRDFTELGSGFKIAMRDLSIRGAGNLLGSQQHGFIDAVGFDMYSQMLEEAVRRKQGKEEKVERSQVEFDLAIDAYIPSSYISDERQKIEIYKRIRQLQNHEEFDELVADILDRFGDLPAEVENLLNIGNMKMDAERALVEKIQRKETRSGSEVKVMISKLGTKKYLPQQYFEVLASTKLRATLGEEKDRMAITLQVPRELSTSKWLQELVRFLEALRKVKAGE